VAADSGIGKSSLCRAGVVPAVVDGQLGDRRAWSHLTLVPGARPLTTLIAGLARALEVDEKQLAREVAADLNGIGRAIAARTADQRGVLLFIDQAEELVTLSDPGEAACFTRVLGALTGPQAPVRLLPAVIKFGERAVVHLVDLLRSRKAYLRQGSALALGILKSGDGIDPLVELLLGEPTEIWREVARAVGETGGGAVMSLAARLRDPEAQDADMRERIAWALAHTVAKGARGPVETLAAGRDVTAAAAARRALELAASARDNDFEVRGPVAPRDQTVNRAFSRRFFEALGVAPPSATDEISGSVLLDDDELLEADEELIDDDDILPS